MNCNKQLLEEKINKIIDNYIFEKESKLGIDYEKSSKAYKKRYTEIRKKLSEPEINATQVMASALGFSADDDSARSLAFKKLHRKPFPEADGVYLFDEDEVAKIWSKVK